MNIYDKFNRISANGDSLLTPFVVSKEKKILFLHIAKTAGTTVVSLMREAGLDDGILTAKGAYVERKQKYFKEIADNWEDYFKFTFVRNKYDLLVSLWHYEKVKHKRNGRDFRTFVTDYVLPNEDEYDYWIDQYYLTTSDGLPIFDAVGRFENFDNDFAMIAEKIGVEYTGQKFNIGPYNHKVHYSTFYDEDLQKKVYGKFKDEIDYYGFEVEHNLR